MNKPVIYIDLDGTLCDFKDQAYNYGIDLSDQEILREKTDPKIQTSLDLVMGIESFWVYMKPIKGALEAYEELDKLFNVYILSTPVYFHPVSYSGKRRWVQKHLGAIADKKLILSHNKSLLKGDILIDDREVNGAKDFGGKLILFGSDSFPDWNYTLNYLLHIYPY